MPLTRRKRRREQTCVGVAWYREDQWALLQRLAVDPDQLEPTYAEWRVAAIRVIEKLRQAGYLAERVDADVEALAEWCAAEGRPLDAAARSEYAAWRLRGRSIPH